MAMLITKLLALAGMLLQLGSLALAQTAQGSGGVSVGAQGNPPATAVAGKTLIDYFQPTPLVGALTKEAWGADNVLPRDPKNGLEDETIKKFCYWDGQIIKGTDGKYHMFASRWDQARGHNG